MGKPNKQNDEQTYEILGAAMEVHTLLGPGFLETVYQEALAIELSERAIPFQREVWLTVHYKGRQLRAQYRADFVCFDDVIVEVKAVESLTPRHAAQLLNYLKATGKHRGLLLNFGAQRLQYHRIVNRFEE